VCFVFCVLLFLLFGFLDVHSDYCYLRILLFASSEFATAFCSKMSDEALQEKAGETLDTFPDPQWLPSDVAFAAAISDIVFILYDDDSINEVNVATVSSDNATTNPNSSDDDDTDVEN
jgi:hypothetical protein